MFEPIGWLEICLRLGAACGLAAILGLNREIHDKPAGFRTHMLVAMGAALFVLVRKATADRVLEGLKGEGGTVLKTSLDHTKEVALQAALAGVQAAVPSTPS